MNTIRTAALVAALATVSASSLAQESAAQAPARQPPAAAQPPPAAEPTPPAAEPTPPPPATEERGVVKDGEFIPTQELNADEAVTFPVDI